MLAKKLFSNLKQAVKTAGGLKRSGSAHHSQNRQNDVDRGLAGFEVETEDKNDQTDTGNQAEGHAALTGAIEQRDQKNR